MIVLIICNLLLVVWQLFFIDDLGSNFKVNDNWWGKHSRIQRDFLLDQFFSEEKAKGDFVDFIDRQRFSTFFMSMFLLNMLFNAVTAFYFLLCLAAKIAGHLATVDISRGWKFLYVQLVINLVLSLVFAEWTHKYVRLHHLRRLQLFLDFFVPTDKFIWQFVSVEYPSKKIKRIFTLSDNQLDFFFSAFANKGELLDRMMLANKILKRNDAERVVKNNQQLANELKSIYRDVLSTMDHSLSAVTNLEKKQKIAGKQLQKLNANRDGDNFVKQFKVIKELHRWGTK